MKTIIIIGLMMLGLLFQNSFSQDSGSSSGTNEKNGKQKVVDKKAMKVFLDKIEVYGRVAKPQTVFIIPGSDPRVNGIRIERRFFSDMFRKVEKSTLRKEKVKEKYSKDHLLW